jgi:hypothetical protein
MAPISCGAHPTNADHWLSENLLPLGECVTGAAEELPRAARDGMRGDNADRGI